MKLVQLITIIFFISYRIWLHFAITPDKNRVLHPRKYQEQVRQSGDCPQRYWTVVDLPTNTQFGKVPRTQRGSCVTSPVHFRLHFAGCQDGFDASWQHGPGWTKDRAPKSPSHTGLGIHSHTFQDVCHGNAPHTNPNSSPESQRRLKY